MTENTSFLPSYTATHDQNHAYIRQILPLMRRHDVPIDPINFAVWYHYVAGISVELNEEIDILTRKRKLFDTDLNLRLYKSYVCNASVESFEHINSNLLRLIAETSLSVDATNEKVTEAGDNFSNKLSELDTDENPKNLKDILLEVMLETKQLADISQDLKNKLDDSRKEMEALRNEMKNVRVAVNMDALTGLLSRSGFETILNELIEEAPIRSACLVLLDIDHFKRVNDTFGHLIGDKVIKYLASMLKKHAPEHYYLARFGGEEMAIVMPNTSLKAAFSFMDKIRIIMENSQLKYKNDTAQLGKVTFSAGIATLQETDTAYSLIERADNALYKAKDSGRNKVVTEKHIVSTRVQH